MLQSLQSLPSTAAGQAALSADLAAVVAIYAVATAAQRAQAVQNALGVVYSGSYEPVAQFNIWQETTPGSQIASTLGTFPQLGLSAGLIDGMTGRLVPGTTKTPVGNAIAELLIGDGTSDTNNIISVQPVWPLKQVSTVGGPVSSPSFRQRLALSKRPIESWHRGSGKTWSKIQSVYRGKPTMNVQGKKRRKFVDSVVEI